jgi:probable HAF family extracellular repeat protein
MIAGPWGSSRQPAILGNCFPLFPFDSGAMALIMSQRHQGGGSAAKAYREMPVLKCVRLAVWLGLSLVVLASQAVASTLTITDLGTLGGSTSTGTAINNNGYAVGSSLTSGGATDAFEYNPNTNSMTDLGVIAGQTSSVANGINNSQVVVGQSGTLAFEDTGSGLVSLGTGVANAINDSGVVIGSIPNGTRNSFTVEWDASNTRTTFFSTLNSQSQSINDSGHFVGAEGVTNGTFSQGYYADGTSTVTFTRSIGSLIPNDVNNNNIIAGQDTFILHEAAIYTVATSSLTGLGFLSGTSSSTASGINSTGTVVGTSGTAGFEWTQAGGMVSLTSLLGSAFSGWTIVSASSINDNGQILAEGQFGGVTHAVILSATPEPSTLVLAALAGLLLAARRRRA